MRSPFETHPENAREALCIILGPRRLRDGPGPHRGFRVEGLFVQAETCAHPGGAGNRQGVRLGGSGGGPLHPLRRPIEAGVSHRHDTKRNQPPGRIGV